MSKLTSEVDIVLDRPRKLRFGFNAWSDYESAMNGQTLPGLFWKIKKANDEEKGSAFALIGIRELRAMLWAGLRHEQPDLTLEQAGDLLELLPGEGIVGKITHLVPILLQSWNLSQGDFAGKKNGPPPALEKSPGTVGAASAP